MNFVILVGNVGGEVKSGKTQNGKLWSNFSMATNRRKKDGTFEPTWHRVVCWDYLAQHSQELKKGDRIYVKGEISVREYERNGVKERSFEIVAQELLRANPFANVSEHPTPQPVPEEGTPPW